VEVGGGAGAAWAGGLRWHVAGWPGWRSFLVRVLVDGLLLVVFCVSSENLDWDCSLRMLVESVKAKLLVPVFLLLLLSSSNKKACARPCPPPINPKTRSRPSWRCRAPTTRVSARSQPCGRHRRAKNAKANIFPGFARPPAAQPAGSLLNARERPSRWSESCAAPRSAIHKSYRARPTILDICPEKVASIEACREHRATDPVHTNTPSKFARARTSS